jgi:regulation of enolase protein 1 (concanavalin A-like superfamily)
VVSFLLSEGASFVAQWEHRDGRLTFRTSVQVDFWRHTLVKTVRDSGHLYGPARLVNAALTTHGWSEWSVLPQSDQVHEAIWMEVRREGPTFFLAHSLDGKSFTPIKLFALPDAGPVMVGPYATSPTGNGFDVWFDSLDIKQ